MNESPYPAPAACVEPSLGAEATQALGRAPSLPVVAHLAICPDCRLVRAEFEAAAAGAVPLDSGMRDRLRRLALRSRRRNAL